MAEQEKKQDDRRGFVVKLSQRINNALEDLGYSGYDRSLVITQVKVGGTWRRPDPWDQHFQPQL